MGYSGRPTLSVNNRHATAANQRGIYQAQRDFVLCFSNFNGGAEKKGRKKGNTDQLKRCMPDSNFNIYVE